jgi:hypothetical protein
MENRLPDFIDSDYLARSLAQSEDGAEPIPIYLRAAITPAELAKLQRENYELRQKVFLFEATEKIYPLTAKLMKIRSFFLPVSIDAPYFEGVFVLIRAREMELGRWSDDDQIMMDAVLGAHEQLKGEENAG